jgi:methionyl-tRNA formyltransferase
VTDPAALAAVPHDPPRRIVYLGTPAMAVPPLEALVAAGFDVALVITRIDTRRGRGGEMSPSPVKAAARRLGLPVAHTVDEALAVGADLGVVVAFGQLIRRRVLEALPFVNLHFSLLPRWRGAAPVERALLAGDAVTGVCLMQIEEGLDTGPVFARVEVPITSATTGDSLRAELVAAGTTLLVESLRTGLGEPEPQSGEASHAAKFTAEDLRIDWARPAAEIDRLVRLGGAWTLMRGKRLKVHTAVVDSTGSDMPDPAPGVVEGSRVGCGDGAITLVDVQPEGKAAMTWIAFANGARPQPGEMLGEPSSAEATP